MATLGTEKSGCCREVRSFLIWAPHSRVLYSVNISVKYGNQANATAAVPSHFNQPGHSITDMELNPLESRTLSISHRTGREAYLMDGKILSPDGLNGRNEN